MAPLVYANTFFRLRAGPSSTHCSHRRFNRQQPLQPLSKRQRGGGNKSLFMQRLTRLLKGPEDEVSIYLLVNSTSVLQHKHNKKNSAAIKWPRTWTATFLFTWITDIHLSKYILGSTDVISIDQYICIYIRNVVNFKAWSYEHLYAFIISLKTYISGSQCHKLYFLFLCILSLYSARGFFSSLNILAPATPAFISTDTSDC